MAVTVHKGVANDQPPITEEGACAGCPRGVWPPVVAPFCVGVPFNQDRHRDRIDKPGPEGFPSGTSV